jgi:hypothetical protein
MQRNRTSRFQLKRGPSDPTALRQLERLLGAEIPEASTTPHDERLVAAPAGSAGRPGGICRRSETLVSVPACRATRRTATMPSANLCDLQSRRRETP